MKLRFSAPLGLFLLGMGVAGVQMAYFYPRLPLRLATHFGPTGYPDGWMSKAGFVTFFAVLLLSNALLFWCIALLLPRLPMSAINLMNKEYWLAPERRAETIDTIRDQILWFGAGTFALLVSVMQMVFNANLTPTPVLGKEVWVLLGGYFLFVALWMTSLLRRFRLPA